jgi:hypothetical protein
MFSPSFEWNAVGRRACASAPAAAWDCNPEGDSEPVANMLGWRFVRIPENVLRESKPFKESFKEQRRSSTPRSWTYTYTKTLGGWALVAPAFRPASLAFRAWSRYGDCRTSATACGSKVPGETSNPLSLLSGARRLRAFAKGTSLPL